MHAQFARGGQGVRVGISEPAHDEQTLEQYRSDSARLITVDEKTMSRYQWSQEQRRVETALRDQEDRAALAGHSGNTEIQRDAQHKINRLRAYYERISEQTGIAAGPERMAVSGFRPVKASELKKAAQNATIKVAGREVNPQMRAQKQRQHIWGTKEFTRRTEQAKEKNKPLPSAFFEDVDIDALVRSHMGKGSALIGEDGAVTEYFSAGEDIGRAYLMATGEYAPTRRVCIKYSQNGWLAFPVKEVKK